MKIGAIPSSVAIIRTPPKPEPTEEASTSSTKESVSLSVEGLKLSASMAQVDAQNDQAREKYERIYGRNSFGDKLWAQIRAQGRDTPVMPESPNDYSDEQLTQIKKSFEFLLIINEQRKITDNPFAGLSRSELVAIVEDETGRYTDVERYTADYAKDALDLSYFRTAMNFGNDGRPLSRAYIDFLDSLSPAERLRFPAGDREMSERLLAQEEQRLGKLPAEFSIWELMAQEGRSLNKEIPAAG
uniref:hypothetical protein n=1 Tax=Pseudomonas laurentiana TaxID=2364649 RepID=UPI0029C8C20E|nr:hypothetical protein [Pseudomonas laurentiana]